MENKLITGIIGVVVVVALLGSALVPVIDGLTEGEKTTNEGAGWIRMDYVTGASYSVDVSFDAQGNVKVDYGVPGSGMTDTQTHAADEDTILFASSEMSIWLQDGVINILGKDVDDNVIFDQITESGPIAFLTKDGSGSQFNIDAGATTGLKASTWAYVPKTTGNFAFFDAGTPVEMKDYPVAAVGGGFAGVYASNAAAMYGLPLQMQTEFDDDGKLIAAYWEKASDPEQLNTMEFDPSTITIQPLDPSIIDLDPIDLGGGMQLMSVPTPTYTDGDWGYDTTTVGGVTKAIIVSYSGAGGNIVIPATVGGYDVYQVGKGVWNNPVFNNSNIATSTLTISNGITVIGASAFQGCNKLTGQLVIPDSVTTINSDSFNNCTGFTGEVVIPDTVTTLGAAFRFCSGLTSIVYPAGITSIPDQFLQNCSGLTGQLVIPNTVTWIGTQSYSVTGYAGDLIIPSSVITIRGSAFSSCTGLDGTLVIPSSVTTMTESNVFSNTKFVNLVVASESDFNSSVFNNMNSLSEVLDLSDAIDYDTARHGIPAAATVSDSIGDAIGYVSFIEIGSEAELSGGAAALLIAVPIVVIAGLLVAFVGYSIVKRF